MSTRFDEKTVQQLPEEMEVVRIVTLVLRMMMYNQSPYLAATALMILDAIDPSSDFILETKRVVRDAFILRLGKASRAELKDALRVHFGPISRSVTSQLYNAHRQLFEEEQYLPPKGKGRSARIAL